MKSPTLVYRKSTAFKCFKSGLLLLGLLFRLTIPALAGNSTLHAVPVVLTPSGVDKVVFFDSTYLRLGPLERFPDKLQIRVSLAGMKVDLFSGDSLQYSGLLTLFTTQYKQVKDKEHQQDDSKEAFIFSQRIPINTENARKLAAAILSSGQSDLQTDTMINGWSQRYLDCNVLHFEFAIGGRYLSQQFYCPWGQSEAILARRIVIANLELLKRELQTDSAHERFVSALPKGRTYSDDGFTHYYLLTDAQLERWEKSKPVRDYLKSKRELINSMINAEIASHSQQFNDINYSRRFYLKFNRRGRLLSIGTHASRTKLFAGRFEDAAEYRACRRKIVTLFRTVDLSSLKLKYGFRRTIGFDLDDGIQLYDETIYGSEQ